MPNRLGAWSLVVLSFALISCGRAAQPVDDGGVAVSRESLVADDCIGNVGRTADEKAYCGVGACMTTGVGHCQDSRFVASCTPDLPLNSDQRDTTCDEIDDDCDGITDEQCELCGDGIDNDRNGRIDCDRTSCPRDRPNCGTPPSICVDDGLCADKLVSSNRCDLSRPSFPNYWLQPGFLGTVALNTRAFSDNVDEDRSCIAGSKPLVPARDIAIYWEPPAPISGASQDSFVIDTAGSEVDTLIQMYRGCDQLYPFACNDDAFGTDAARIDLNDALVPRSVPPRSGNDGAPGYWIVLQTADGSDGNIALTIRRQPLPENCELPPAGWPQAGRYDPIDEDLDGLADCDDPDCLSACVGRDETSLCTNGVDDDDDKTIDCSDHDCVDHPLCCTRNGRPCTPAVCRAVVHATDAGTFPVATAFGAPVTPDSACAPNDDATRGEVRIQWSPSQSVRGEQTYRFRVTAPHAAPILSLEPRCDLEGACVNPSFSTDGFVRSGFNARIDGDSIVATVDTRAQLTLSILGPIDETGLMELSIESVETGASCNNQRDDDDDGFRDCQDSDCAAFCPNGERGFCTNGLDDDQDRATDCDDANCERDPACRASGCADGNLGSLLGTVQSVLSAGRTETNSRCGATPLGPAHRFLWTPPNGASGTFVFDTRGSAIDTVLTLGTCTNTTVCDDDSAGEGASQIVWTPPRRGATDPIVISVHGFNAESGAFVLNIARELARSPELCSNGLNDDGDRDTDCLDSDCASDLACVAGLENCANGVDDDRDGVVDCEDDECRADLRCASAVEVCRGGVDEDRDGLIDCLDPDCVRVDSDSDGTPDCRDQCPDDPSLVRPGVHYRDSDGDTWGAPNVQSVICATSGWVTRPGDCRDDQPTVWHSDDDRVCDGRDSDCDRGVDEAFQPHGSACGRGACASQGDVTCQDGREVDSCEPGMPTGDDSDCNALDNDCDARIDESFPTTDTSCGVGACARQGIDVCVAGAVTNTCVAGAPASADRTCDGIDDDCNGVNDDGYEGSQTSCGRGACASQGVAICVSGVAVDTCVAGTPTAETCDGIDNSCDGIIDDGVLVDCYGDPDGDDYSGSSLVIAQQCSCGENLTARAPVPGAIDCEALNGSVHPGADEACDAIDTDCDGSVDEGVQITCYADGDDDGFGGSVNASVLACACSAGFTALRPEPGSSQDCDDDNASTAPGANETCDDSDNDCDGSVDEDAGCIDDGEPYVGAPCLADDDCIGADLPTGFCYTERDNGIVGGVCLSLCPAGECPDQSWCLQGEANGVQAAFCVPGCDSAGGCVRPDGQCMLASANNNQPVTYCLPFCSSDSECSEGRYCREGICESGERYCDIYSSNPDADCDGYDQDCDGAIDEGYSGLSQCASDECGGVGGLTCAGGVITTTCDESAPECQADAVTTHCVRDDDCTSLGSDWSCLPESQGFVGGRCVQYCSDTTVCGVGTECADGRCLPTCDSNEDCRGAGERCLLTGGTGHGTCVPFCVDDSQCVRDCNDDSHLCDCQRETCDGDDNDCDGVVDEGDVCGCTPTSETCDGDDNDCDGAIDEGFASECVAAACVSNSACVNGALIACPALPESVCNGVDDDCDGSTDEDYDPLYYWCSCGVFIPQVCENGVMFTPCERYCVEDCGNGIDDNYDGQVDCDDDGCVHEPTCVANSPVGTQCATNADCPLYSYVVPVLGSISFQMCQTAIEGVGGGSSPIGYCLAMCSPELGIFCPGGSVCADGLCLRACDDNGECGDPALACAAYPTQSGGSVDACVPYCDADADCPGGKSCVQVADNTPGTLSAGVCRDCASSDATCNAHDDDCDGLIDEDWGDNGSGYEEYSCGVGVCTRYGERICAYDGVVDFGCTPGNPIPTALDVESGMDEDCDGLVDEDSCNLIGCDSCFECNGVTGLCEDHGACQPCGGICDSDELCNESEGTCVPTYATVYREIFAPKCNNATCHGAAPFAGDLPLTAARNVAINAPAVDIACPDMVKGECALELVRNGTMPRGVGCVVHEEPYPQANNDNPNCLNENEYRVLERWVAAGGP